MSRSHLIGAAFSALLFWLTTASVVIAADAALKPGTLPPAAMKLLLPYEAPNKHLGVATCSSSVCHGSVKSKSSSYDVQLNEYVTWSHDDSHAKAYSVLKSERSRVIAAKLGLPNAYDAKICLDCHADNVAAAARGKEFNITDGIGCEACHGGAEKWIESHTMKTTSYEDNLKNGMYPTATLSS
ncbi:MAG TPA: multiheme c-type cytochrome, partial [Polyangiales bacterium]|nr:multiheme c-type cytochrome [Polyangiales bacterium]